MERYFDGNLEKLFAECHVINPSKKSRTRQMNTRSSAQVYMYVACIPCALENQKRVPGPRPGIKMSVNYRIGAGTWSRYSSSYISFILPKNRITWPFTKYIFYKKLSNF